MSAYTRLEQRFKRLNALKEAAGVLQWDMSTMMPAGGAAARGEQLAALEVTCHELIADPAANPGGLPIGRAAEVSLPIDHLQYDITWYALALVW